MRRGFSLLPSTRLSRSYNARQWALLAASLPLLAFYGVASAYWPLQASLAYTVVVLIALAVFCYRKTLYPILLLAPLDPAIIGLSFRYQWSIPERDYFPLYPFVLVFGFAGMLLARLRPGARLGPPDTLIPLLFLFLAYAWVSAYWSPSVPHGQFHAAVLAAGVLLYVFVVTAIDSKDLLYRVCWFWIIFGFLVGLANLAVRYCPDVIIQEHLFGRTVFELTIRGLPVITRSDTISNANNTALTLNLFLSAALGMYLWERSKARRAFLLLVGAAMLFGQFLNQSKGGTLGFVLMTGYFLVVFARLRRNFIMHGALLAFAFIGTFVASIFYLAGERTPRLIAGEATEGISMATRFRMWSAGWDALMQNGAFTGLGSGGFIRIFDPPHAHSLYLSILFDFGIAGLALFLLLMLVAMLRTSRMLPHQESFAQIMFLALSGGLIPIAFHGLFDTQYTVAVFHAFLGLCSAAYFLARDEIVTSHRGSAARETPRPHINT
jgi:hypothetical protein